MTALIVASAALEAHPCAWDSNPGRLMALPVAAEVFPWL